MNQLTKLIEQWCGDDQDSARGFIELFNYDKKQAKSWTRFVEFLASRPTCGEEQRKFLDELEKLQKTHKEKDTLYRLAGHDYGASQLWQGHFSANILKVIRGE